MSAPLTKSNFVVMGEGNRRSRAALILGTMGFGAALVAGVWLLYPLSLTMDDDLRLALGSAFLGLVGCAFAIMMVMRWRNIRFSKQSKLIRETGRLSSARWARPEELSAYIGAPGISLGGGYTWSGKGHLLTCAGTSSDAGTNVIIPNLLGTGGYQGSWVVIDVDGKSAAATSRYQQQAGQNVIVLNPWALPTGIGGHGNGYNPLDVLSDTGSVHIVDDARMIAEMLLPLETGERVKSPSDHARSLMTGLLLHLVTSQPRDAQTLGTICRWVRLREVEWEGLLGDMAVNNDPVSGEMIRSCAYEVLKLISTGERAYAMLLTELLRCTTFLTSPALNGSLRPAFDPYTLAHGNTTVYIIIPANKLHSHARWLRLVIMSLMRAAVRQPANKVCFLLNPFSALGYLSELETALPGYAEKNVTLWPFVQSLIQMKAIYKNGWEVLIGNATVRQYLGVNDAFTASYISKALGQVSDIVVSRDFLGRVRFVNTHARALAMPDQIRRASQDNIFMFLGGIAPTFYPQAPMISRRRR